MKMPNGERAVVDLVKLADYCLNSHHPRGKHKARVFRAACGFSPETAESMRDQILDAATTNEARPIPPTVHGKRYVLECVLTGPAGQALVRTAWIIRPDEDFPRFVSAYVV
jgi:hypothetical protein